MKKAQASALVEKIRKEIAANAALRIEFGPEPDIKIEPESDHPWVDYCVVLIPKDERLHSVQVFEKPEAWRQYLKLLFKED